MPDLMSSVVEFIQNNIILIGVVAVAIFFGYKFLKLNQKTKFTVLKRSEIEKKNMERRLKNNPSTDFRWLYQRNETGYGRHKLIGKITHFRDVVTNNPHEQHFLQMRIQPIIFNFGMIRIPNPFGKFSVFQITDDGKIIKDPYDHYIVIPSNMKFDYHMGIDYNMDANTLDGHMNLINNQLLETEYDLQASRFFVKSQEECVYAPQLAHELAMKQKEIELELAKRKGKLTSI